MTGPYRIWDALAPKPIERQYRISLCTTCMGRLADLERTLPVNLELNAGYLDLEFVILDYNSPDGLQDWMRRTMKPHLDSGRVVYYRTEEPRFYSMTHSRNVAFKLASGDIVCNVDADNYTLDQRLSSEERPRACFAERLNYLANQLGRRVFFAKSRQLLRGRLGFFRREFMEELGGYDEGLLGYGRDDDDLRNRAWALGYTMMRFDGPYVDRIKTTREQKGALMADTNWRRTERDNAAKSAVNIAARRLQANVGKAWGRTVVRRNFEQWIEL